MDLISSHFYNSWYPFFMFKMAHIKRTFFVHPSNTTTVIYISNTYHPTNILFFTYYAFYFHSSYLSYTFAPFLTLQISVNKQSTCKQNGK